MKSVEEWHPDSARYVVVIDDSTFVGLEDRRGTKLVGLQELGMDAEEFRVLSGIYNTVELATAVKPFVLRSLRGRYSRVTFLDPDTKLFGSLDCIFTSSSAPIVLTPHRITPPPLDRLTPDERLIKTFGVYNLGFVSVSADDAEFLDWWWSRTRRFARIAPTATEFTEQRWIDLAPGYFTCEISRHRGANVAPWNIDERELSLSSNGHLLVADEPLLFAHFSALLGRLRSHGVLFELPNQERCLPGSSNFDLFVGLAQDWFDEVSHESELLADSGCEREPMSRRELGRLQRRRNRAHVLRDETLGQPITFPKWTIPGLNSRLTEKLMSSHVVEAVQETYSKDLERLRQWASKTVHVQLRRSRRRGD